MQLTFHATGAPDNVTLNSLNTLTFWDLKKAADSLEAFLVNFCNLRLNSNVGKVKAAIWRFLHNFSQNLHFSFQRLEFMVSARQMESNHSTNLKHYYLFTLIKQITQYLHHICSQIMFH